MGKKYLGRNINMFLVLMIIVCVGSIVIISTYYNYRYQIISNSHNEIAKDLKNKTKILENTQNELKNLKTTYAQTSTDVKKYDELYLGKVTELESTQEKLTKLKVSYAKSQEELIIKVNALSAEQRKTSNLEHDLANVRSDLSKAKKIIDKCQDGLRGDSEDEDACLDYNN